MYIYYSTVCLQEDKFLLKITIKAFSLIISNDLCSELLSEHFENRSLKYLGTL